MKVNTAIAALGGTMFIAASTHAAFVGIGWREVANGGAADRTIDVYAEFDNSLDELNAVAGTVLNTLSIRVVGGTYYQNGFGGTTAPNPLLIPGFPSVAFDSFVTIGSLDSSQGFDPGTNSSGDQIALTPGFPAWGSTELGGANGGDNMVWSVTPGNFQGVAGSAINNTNIGGNRVILARLSANGAGPVAPEFEGEFSIQGFAGGNLLEEDVSFSTASVPAPGALALLGLAGLAGTRRRRA
jgi:MYXO-CTERM domain-containing protein